MKKLPRPRNPVAKYAGRVNPPRIWTNLKKESSRKACRKKIRAS